MDTKKLKVRVLPESNYKAIWYDGKTLRIPLDHSKPITELKYPEFYDLKVTGHCRGKCPYCYMDSKDDCIHYENIVQKVRDFFGPMTKDQRPLQVALGGGSPESHPDFIKLLEALVEMDIVPNYTSNGMDITPEILEATVKYCGGVAVSCHPHLEEYWQEAVRQFIMNKVRLNLHIIISDRESVDQFMKIYETYHGWVDYFVLLPYSAVGRAEPKELDFDYLFERIVTLPSNKDIAYGANFYEKLKTGVVPVSLYEPEMMSKFLDLKDMKLYPSSFNLTPIN